MSHEEKLINLTIQQSVPLLKYILSAISKEYNLDYSSLENKYIKKLINNKYAKKRQRMKGRQTKYSMFLKDKNVNDKIRLKYGNNLKFPQISKIKGEIWAALSKKDKQKYADLAKKQNVINFAKKKQLATPIDEENNVNSTTTINHNNIN